MPCWSYCSMGKKSSARTEPDWGQRQALTLVYSPAQEWASIRDHFSMKPVLPREFSASATQFPPTSQFQHLSEALKVIKVPQSLDFQHSVIGEVGLRKKAWLASSIWIKPVSCKCRFLSSDSWNGSNWLAKHEDMMNRRLFFRAAL